MAITKNEMNVQDETKEVARQKRKFAKDDLILCRSTCCGELLLVGKKTDVVYRWADFGDTTEVEYQDLQALRSMSSAYLKKPLFIIMDEDVVEQWPEMQTFYKSLATLDADTLFELPLAKFKKQLTSLPPAFKDTIKDLAAKRIATGEIDSIAKIKAIDDALGTDLKFYLD